MNLKNSISTLLLSFIVTLSISAHNHAAPPPANKGKIYDDPDIPAIFTGGTSAMHQFIASSLKYPPEAAAQNKQGLVVYTFVVEEDGSLKISPVRSEAC